MVRATGQDGISFCLACFTGDYPVPVDPNAGQIHHGAPGATARICSLPEDEHPELFAPVLNDAADA